MDYASISAKIPEALALHSLTIDPLALDAVRVLQELLVDLHNYPDHTPTPMQEVALHYLDRMTSARATLGI